MRVLGLVLCLLSLAACNSKTEPLPSPAPIPQVVVVQQPAPPPEVIVIPPPVPISEAPPVDDGIPEGAAGIIGGQLANPGQWPEVGWSGGVSGTLVAPRWVVTAAHGKTGGGTKWTFTQPDGTKRTYVTEMTFVNPLYKPSAFSLGNDIALCLLKEPVTGIEPATLATIAPKTKTPLDIVGWGLTGTGVTGQTGGAGIKRYGPQVVDFMLAPHLLWMFDKGETASIAQGDSGGAAFRAGTHELLGVASGVSAGAGGKIGVFGTYVFETRVDVHREWLASTMAKVR